MSSIKKLASQTVWYGISSIAARFINNLLTPYLTYADNIHPSDYGIQSLVYSAIPILNVIFTYGFETTYFRFSGKEENKSTIYSTSFFSLFFSTILLTSLLWMFRSAFGNAIGVGNFPQIIQLAILIIGVDALSRIPLARLRQQGRPKKFAFVTITGICFNIFFTWFFVGYCYNAVKHHPDSWVTFFYDPKKNPIVYVVLANLIQSIVTLFLLSAEIAQVRFVFNTKLWKQMMIYSLPLIIVGMGGMVNETFDRLMLRWWLPGSAIIKDTQVGIYSACYKISILITLFINAFRMGAEPFFFKQAEGQNPQRVFARVMKFFVIIICIMFLAVSLFMPIWKHFIGPKYWAGLSVVPILLLANMFIGIYYNLSVWYKLSNKTSAGAWITVGGAALTTIINFAFIPRYGYYACAWATFFCYGSMMVASFVWGQKEYRIPYPWKKLTAYLLIVVLLFFAHKFITSILHGIVFSLTVATVLTAFFIWFVGNVEKKELPQLPLIGKYFKK